MSDKDDKKDRDREDKPYRAPAPRTGHVAPPDPELVRWLERLWTRGTPPDRLEVWWVLGVNKDVRRGLVFYENFKPDQALNLEECARLAGEILSAAQNWTDSKRRLCFFEIAITDYHQATVPLSRPIGPLMPRQAYAGVQPDGEPVGLGDEDGDGEIGLKPLSHRYLSKTIRSVHRTMEETHAIIGDTMRMMQAIMLSQQSHNERLQNTNMALYDQKQTAEDRSAERAVWVTRETAKTKAIESSLKVGTTLLYGWLGMPPEEANGAGQQGGGQAGETPGVRLHPASMEQRHVESFLEEAAEEKLSMQLFGDWEDTDKLTLNEVFAGLGLKEPGIFSPQQFGILLAVRARLLPPDALDPLLSDSGLPQAITTEQTLKAAPLMTQNMMVTLGQIRQLRLAARDKREALSEQAAAPAQNGEAR